MSIVAAHKMFLKLLSRMQLLLHFSILASQNNIWLAGWECLRHDSFSYLFSILYCDIVCALDMMSVNVLKAIFDKFASKWLLDDTSMIYHYLFWLHYKNEASMDGFELWEVPF